MGLDATVYCDCFERGRLRSEPKDVWRVYVDECGCRESGAREREHRREFERWSAEACGHDRAALESRRLGNMSTIALVRELVEPRREEFPVLIERVVYTGSHGGDFLEPDGVQRLAGEMVGFASVHADTPDHESLVRRFESDLNALIAIASPIGKPIAF